VAGAVIEAAYLLNILRSVAVKRGGLYRTESDYKKMRSGTGGNSCTMVLLRHPYAGAKYTISDNGSWTNRLQRG